MSELGVRCSGKRVRVCLAFLVRPMPAVSDVRLPLPRGGSRTPDGSRASLFPFRVPLVSDTHLSSGAILNDFIRHYEPVEYDASALAAQHRRVRRSSVASADVQLRFRASDRSGTLPPARPPARPPAVPGRDRRAAPHHAQEINVTLLWAGVVGDGVLPCEVTPLHTQTVERAADMPVICAKKYGAELFRTRHVGKTNVTKP